MSPCHRDRVRHSSGRWARRSPLSSPEKLSSAQEDGEAGALRGSIRVGATFRRGKPRAGGIETAGALELLHCSPLLAENSGLICCRSLTLQNSLLWPRLAPQWSRGLTSICLYVTPLSSLTLLLYPGDTAVACCPPILSVPNICIAWRSQQYCRSFPKSQAPSHRSYKPQHNSQTDRPGA